MSLGPLEGEGEEEDFEDGDGGEAAEALDAGGGAFWYTSEDEAFEAAAGLAALGEDGEGAF